jgi:hypothetical protein
MGGGGDQQVLRLLFRSPSGYLLKEEDTNPSSFKDRIHQLILTHAGGPLSHLIRINAEFLPTQFINIELPLAHPQTGSSSSSSSQQIRENSINYNSRGVYQFFFSAIRKRTKR